MAMTLKSGSRKLPGTLSLSPDGDVNYVIVAHVRTGKLFFCGKRWAGNVMAAKLYDSEEAAIRDINAYNLSETYRNARPVVLTLENAGLADEG